MSRTFSSASDNLKATSGTAYVTPFTVSLWFKQAVINAATERLFQVGTGTSGNNFFALYEAGSTTTRYPTASVNDSGTTTYIAAASAYTDTNWHHHCGVFASTTSRSAYRDGGAKGGPETTSRVPTGSMTALRISGALTDSAPILNGSKVAYVGVWDIALSDSEVAELATKAPNLVRADHLVEYWALGGNQSPEPSSGSRGTNLTVAGTSYDADMPTIDTGAGRRRGFNTPIGLRFVRVY